MTKNPLAEKTEMNATLKSKLQYTKQILGGIQHVFRFDNNFGASVVRHSGSYGNQEGKWELAVLDKNDDLTYTTPITNDVLGWLEWDDVLDTLWEISKLPAE
jgi:hypothetical protein